MKHSTYKCLNCDQECKWSYQHSNKYCSVRCSTERRSNEHKKKFFSGLLKTIDRPTARKYLAEVRGYKCEICGLGDWNGKSLTLHVDHTNGDPANDHPDNLRLLCPNCHSQTEFLGAANKGRGRGSQGLKKY
jgi:hypothetical protein